MKLSSKNMKCRHCKSELTHTFVDLGMAPPSNAYLSKEALALGQEKSYPLILKVCQECWLVQTLDFSKAEELFTEDYAYFSSISSSWLKHAAEFSEEVIDRFKLGHSSFLIEIACNDGYLLKNFKNKEIPCLGVEPTKSTASVAINLGINV